MSDQHYPACTALGQRDSLHLLSAEQIQIYLDCPHPSHDTLRIVYNRRLP